ncbi:CatB-related O-acetyltransferase [Pseudomonas sp. App30]|uniref:CatB-related O-acetyltransferase n=1 Tax=Pseudomonas sp. App30 TaxID=3068990 RepID=UPI003A80FE13
MNLLKRIWLDHTLKRALRQHRCRVDCGTRGLRGKVKLTLERHVKLHTVKVFSKELRIGAFTDIVSNTELRDVSSIGRYCSIGTNCVIGQNRKQHPMHWLSTNVALIDQRLEALPSPPAHWDVTPTTIGHDVWVGRDVIIMEGISIGTGAVIGAQSLVTRDVPPYAIVAGSPAKMIRFRFEEPLREQLLASRWWEHDQAELAQLPTEDPEAFLAALARLPHKPLSDATVQVSTSPLRVSR